MIILINFIFSEARSNIYLLLVHMKSYYFIESQFQISDPLKSYFEWISSCDMKDGTCNSRFVEILKKYEN